MACNDWQALRNVWADMHKRCKPEYQGAHRYHARGIGVCSGWSDWRTFREWALANGWRRGLEIDRRDNDRGYSPENCRFVTDLEQSRNRDMAVVARSIRAAHVKRCGKPFVCLETGEVFLTQIDAHRQTGVDRKTLRAALMGKYKQAGGLRWSYVGGSSMKVEVNGDR